VAEAPRRLASTAVSLAGNQNDFPARELQPRGWNELARLLALEHAFADDSDVPVDYAAAVATVRQWAALDRARIAAMN
jgi:hypothetical protein